MKIGSYVRTHRDSWGFTYIRLEGNSWYRTSKIVSCDHRYVIVGMLEADLTNDPVVYVLLMVPQCIITYLSAKEVVEVLCSGLVIW